MEERDYFYSKYRMSFLGGARLGLANVTWPLARLKVGKDEILLRVVIFGTYNFSPEQVAKLECFDGWMGSGIQIHHNVAEYPRTVIFWSIANPKSVVERIRSLGFECKGDLDKARLGFPLRIFPLLFVWAVFYLLVEYSGFIESGRHQIDLGDCFILGLVFLFSLSLKYSAFFHKIFLSPNRHIGEISHVLNLVCCIIGLIMMIALFTSFFAPWRTL